MPTKHKTQIPTKPCRDFYEWYAFIHGHCPVQVRERIDRFGNRRTPESDERDFRRVLTQFTKSLLS